MLKILASYEENLGLVDVTAAEMENGVPDNKGVDNVYPSGTENPSETLKQENVEEVITFEDIDSDVETTAEMEIVVLENNVEVVLSHTENPNEAEETNISSAEEPLVDDVENQGLAKIESDELKLSDSAAQDQNQDLEFPKLHLIEDSETGFAAEEMSNGNAMSADGETSQESLGLAIEDIVGDEISGMDANVDLDHTEHLISSEQLDGEKVADISKTHISGQQAGVKESLTEISADLLSSFFPFTRIPSPEIDAISTQVPSSKTPSKKSATKTPTKSRRVALVSDDKENIDRSGRNLQLPKDMGKKIKKDKTENEQSKKLSEASLRQLTKMLKEKLQITNSVNANEEETSAADTVVTSGAKARPALQTLSSNSLAATGMGN